MFNYSLHRCHRNQKCLASTSLVSSERLYIDHAFCFSYYTDSQKYGAPNAYKFSAGLRQEFPRNVCRLNLGQYNMHDLTHYREDYYPIVIAIESVFPDSYKGRSKKSIQFTCGAF